MNKISSNEHATDFKGQIRNEMGDPKPLRLALAIIALLLLYANIAVFVTYAVLTVNRELVFNTFGEITLSTLFVTYSTWGIVYAYQLIWITYALIHVSQTFPDDPVLISSITLGVYLLALVFNLVVNTVFLLEITFSFLVVTALSALTVLVFTYWSLYKNRNLIAKKNLRKEDSLVRGLVQNGVDVYLTWITLSAILSFGVILTNRTTPPLDPSIAHGLVLIAILVFNFFYVITDVTVFDMYSRYTLAPYFLRLWVIALFLVGTTNVGLIFLEGLFIVFTIFGLTYKFVLIGIRRKTRPLFPRISDT